MDIRRCEAPFDEYSISEFGDLYDQEEKLVRPFVSNGKYWCYSLKTRHFTTKVMVYQHRLLYHTFVGLATEIDHIDRNTFNNDLSNLRACTRSENMKNRKNWTWSEEKKKGVRDYNEFKRQLMRINVSTNP